MTLDSCESTPQRTLRVWVTLLPIPGKDAHSSQQVISVGLCVKSLVAPAQLLCICFCAAVENFSIHLQLQPILR